MIRSHADLVAAYHAGRCHTQRFLKNAPAVAGDGQWRDWGAASGQPAYDARIGPVASFTPAVAVGNDAVYFPGIQRGMERKLHTVTFRPLASNASQAHISVALVDLVGYYPLLDGDSTDTQLMNNDQTLPRYTDGEGLRMILVNQIAPGVQQGRTTIEYVDSKGGVQTVDMGITNVGAEKVANGAIGAVGGATGPLFIPFNAGVTGVRQVNSVTHTVPPGGLHAIMIVKPLAQFQHYHDPISAVAVDGIKAAMEVDFALKDAWRMPTIKDGAHIALFYMPNGGGRTVAMFGDFTFIWG